MNKDRRAAIAALKEKFGAIQNQISELRSDIEELEMEEQEYLDNMPENFQQGERGQAAEEVISHLDDAGNGADTISNDLDTLMESLENAAQ